MVHHIKERRDYPELAYDPDNLISLCFSCHEKYHPDRRKPRKRKSKLNRKIKVVEFKANEELG